MRRRCRRTDRGATLVEAVLVFGFVLVPLILGTFEVGMIWQGRLRVDTAVRSAARVGASLGEDRAADYELLQALVQASGGLDIRRVVVFKATTSGVVPAACTTGSSVAGTCNVYLSADLARPAENFTGGCSGKPDGAWCPTSRATDQGTGLDSLGLYVEVRLSTASRIVPGGVTLKRTVVLQVEPSDER